MVVTPSEAQVMVLLAPTAQCSLPLGEVTSNLATVKVLLEVSKVLGLEESVIFIRAVLEVVVVQLSGHCHFPEEALMPLAKVDQVVLSVEYLITTLAILPVFSQVMFAGLPNCTFSPPSG